MIENNDDPHFKESNEYLGNDNQAFIVPPKRHGCVTSWLLLMLIGNSIFTLIYLVRVTGSTQASNTPKTLLIALVITGFLNVLFPIMLLFWKKIAFYGLGITAVFIFCINLAIGLPKIKALRGQQGLLCFTVFFKSKRTVFPHGII